MGITAFQGVILYSVKSFLSSRKDFNFRHLSSCDTIPYKSTEIFQILNGSDFNILRRFNIKILGEQ